MASSRPSNESRYRSARPRLYTDLRDAVQAKDEETVRRLVAAGAPHQLTFLAHVVVTAAQAGYAPILEFLLQCPQRAGQPAPPLTEALTEAAKASAFVKTAPKTSHYDCAKLLLAAGAKVDPYDCLRVPAMNGDLAMLNLLLPHAGPIGRTTYLDSPGVGDPSNATSALAAAALNVHDLAGDNLVVLDRLLQHEFAVNPAKGPDPVPLFNAVEVDKLAAVKVLVSRYKEAGNPYSYDVLDIAAKLAYVHGHDAVFTHLLESGDVEPGVIAAPLPAGYRPVFEQRLQQSLVMATTAKTRGELSPWFRRRLNRYQEVGAALTEPGVLSFLSFIERRGELSPDVADTLKTLPILQPPNGPPASVLSTVLRAGNVDAVQLFLNMGADFSRATPYSRRAASDEIKQVLKAHARHARLLGTAGTTVTPAAPAPAPSASSDEQLQTVAARNKLARARL